MCADAKGRGQSGVTVLLERKWADFTWGWEKSLLASRAGVRWLQRRTERRKERDLSSCWRGEESENQWAILGCCGQPHYADHQLPDASIRGFPFSKCNSHTQLEKLGLSFPTLHPSLSQPHGVQKPMGHTLWSTNPCLTGGVWDWILAESLPLPSLFLFSYFFGFPSSEKPTLIW